MSDEHLEGFVEFARAHPMGPGLSYDEFVRCGTRAELGISSLNMLILVAGYIDEKGGKAVLQPEWVPLLDDVEGIRKVVTEIDAA